MTKKITLKRGKNAPLLEMSVDKFDECMDYIRYDQKDGEITIKNQFSLSTMWIRSGVDKANDKFIKALSMEDRAELQLAIQEHNSLGE